MARVKSVAMTLGVEPEILRFTELPLPRRMERDILGMFPGSDPRLDVYRIFEGHTELRILSDEQVQEICAMIDAAAC